MVEEVTVWDEGHKIRVLMPEMDSVPIKDAFAEITIEPANGAHTKVSWGLEF